MSKYELKRAIERELRDLNWTIDMKIVRGLTYKSEARRHKFLLMQLNRLKGQTKGVFGKFSNMASALTSFVL